MSTSDDTFRLLYEIAVATSGVLEPERVSQLAAERARQLTGADSALLFWWVPERELLIMLACDPPGSATPGCTRRRGQGAVGRAYETASPQVMGMNCMPTKSGVNAAMAMRCLWPPDSVAPRSPMTVS